MKKIRIQNMRNSLIYKTQEMNMEACNKYGVCMIGLISSYVIIVLLMANSI